MRRATLNLLIWLLAASPVALLNNAYAGNPSDSAHTKPIEQSETVQNEKNTNGFFPADIKWFNDGSASTIFQAEPVKTDSPTVGFYQEKIIAPELNEEFSMEDELTEKTKFNPKGATPEDIVKAFGDPNEDAPLSPVENAPTPFKGLMASLDSGNDELAQQYAKQYIRHLKNLKDRSKKVTDFTKLALSEEEVLEEAEQSVPEDLVPPVDPKGEVDVLFFFRPEEPASLQMTKEINALYAKYANNQKIHISGFSLAKLTPETIEVFQSLYQIKFPIRDGQGVANSLGVRISPTTIFLAKNSNKMFRVEDINEPGYVTSVLNHMISPNKSQQAANGVTK